MKLTAIVTKVMPIAGIGLAAVLARGDYVRFHTIFVQNALPDLSIKMVFDADKAAKD
jgi:hypothetical protein